MSKDLNSCSFIGRLARDPELRQTSGGPVVNFSIACGDDYKKKTGEKVEQTNWINIVAWNRLAEICAQYLTKGSQIHVSGKMTTRKWQDKDGETKYTTEIVASEMQMIGGKSESAPPQAAQQGTTGMAPGDFDDKLPF